MCCWLLAGKKKTRFTAYLRPLFVLFVFFILFPSRKVQCILDGIQVFMWRAAVVELASASVERDRIMIA